MNKFLDTLKKTFGPGRSLNYYRGQLSIAFKKPNKHILDYINHINLHAAIIESDCTLNIAEIAAIDSYALEAFFEGLLLEYRTELKAEGYNNFSDVCSRTIIIH